MAEFNLPPFYIGQKVVALITDTRHGRIKKGNIYTVIDIIKFCNCSWGVDVGARTSSLFSECTDCKIIKQNNGINWIWAGHLAPVIENFRSISLEKVIEEETALVGAN